MTRQRMMTFSSSLVAEEPAVNLTPLIDVVFVILIMFIVIAPLLEMDRVQLANGPQTALTSIQSVQASSPILIHVRQDNTLLFNDQQTSLIELVGQLKEAKQKFPEAHPQVFHDKEAHFGTYQSVKNAVEEAGFATMDIILKPA